MENSKTSFSLFTFDSMLTPKIITFVYWIGLLGLIVGGIGFLVTEDFLIGVCIVAFGFVGWRMWCELMIVFFKMNENLQRIADRNTGV
jgi:hypothetical protein